MNPRGPINAVAPPGPGNSLSAAQGQVPPTPNQQGGILATTIPPGSTVPQQIQGSFFYVIASSAGISVRPKGGSFNTYQPGTGYRLPKQANPAGAALPPIDGSFSMIEIANPNAFSGFVCAFHRLRRIHRQSPYFGGERRTAYNEGYIFADAGTPGPIPILDVSGEAFADQNGETWLAVNRITFYVDNLSTSSNLLLQNSASDGTSCGIIFPATTRTFPVSGDFTLKTGAGDVQAGVIEIYNAISPSIPL